MIDCENLNSGKCKVIKDLSGCEWEPQPVVCIQCSMQLNPKTYNVITIAQAMAARSVSNKPYDHLAKAAEILTAPALPTPTDGPGTELKNLLSRFKVTKTCNCESHAAQMNRWGPDGCEENIDTIAAWLIEEANKRNIPTMFFGKIVAIRLIRIAISRSRRKSNGNAK